MNKQELANKIWKTANDMRSTIEANEYKDFILGFIFYKYLSHQEVKFLKDNDFTDEDIKELTEEDAETVEFIQKNIGYFIDYNNLFSTWIEKKKDFDISDVRDALNAFDRLIFKSHKKVFDNIFKTLQEGLSKLGKDSKSQTSTASSLIQTINEIPMDEKQDYDVLGFIYEYLIEKFASNAGKKAGEFYTPHEVSLLMSEIIADYLGDREGIKIYDPTSGSGSLLINIGHSVAKRMNNSDNIKYYAQELKENTYNLTRMNLVMRGIKPDNIVTRNADTLEEDWPYFDESNPDATYDPLYVDAVVSNPPYSQNWNPTDKANDARYNRYGVAPKGKADYAFLLHDLFHVKPDGIMSIVLPHGVLFRGGEEGEIRKNLVEYNNIDTIIGLPANIFYGTGIPTIIMVLKQKKDNDDVLIIDASKGFMKEGKNNKLRACDIKKIVDTVRERKTIHKYSKVVSREEIRNNDYNLNIPRYVDSSEEAEHWDIYASMYGGIPKEEVNALNEYWDVFPNLKETLFKETNSKYVELKVEDIKESVKQNSDVKEFEEQFKNAFDSFGGLLKQNLIVDIDKVQITKEEEIITEDVFNRLVNVPLIDKYKAYQLIDEEWHEVSTDLEMIQTEGVSCITKVDPNMVVKNKKEVQEGWVGHIIPFDLVQNTLLKEDKDALTHTNNLISEYDSQLSDLVEGISEDDKEEELFNEAGDAFVPKELDKKVKEIQEQITSPEIEALQHYLELSKKADKESFVYNNPQVAWNKMDGNNGSYSKSVVNNYIKTLREEHTFDEDSYEYILCKASSILEKQKSLKSQVKKDAEALEKKTKKTIEGLSKEQVDYLLTKKWIDSLIDNLFKLPVEIVDGLIKSIEALQKKYETTYFDIEKEIKETEASLCSMIDDLVGDEYDMKGLSELKSLLSGE